VSRAIRSLNFDGAWLLPQVGIGYGLVCGCVIAGLSTFSDRRQLATSVGYWGRAPVSDHPGDLVERGLRRLSEAGVRRTLPGLAIHLEAGGFCCGPDRGGGGGYLLFEAEKAAVTFGLAEGGLRGPFELYHIIRPDKLWIRGGLEVAFAHLKQMAGDAIGCSAIAGDHRLLRDAGDCGQTRETPHFPSPGTKGRTRERARKNEAILGRVRRGNRRE